LKLGGEKVTFGGELPLLPSLKSTYDDISKDISLTIRLFADDCTYHQVIDTKHNSCRLHAGGSGYNFTVDRNMANETQYNLIIVNLSIAI